MHQFNSGSQPTKTWVLSGLLIVFIDAKGINCLGASINSAMNYRGCYLAELGVDFDCVCASVLCALYGLIEPLTFNSGS